MRHAESVARVHDMRSFGAARLLLPAGWTAVVDAFVLLRLAWRPCLMLFDPCRPYGGPVAFLTSRERLLSPVGSTVARPSSSRAPSPQRRRRVLTMHDSRPVPEMLKPARGQHEARTRHVLTPGRPFGWLGRCVEIPLRRPCQSLSS